MDRCQGARSGLGAACLERLPVGADRLFKVAQAQHEVLVMTLIAEGRPFAFDGAIKIDQGVDQTLGTGILERRIEPEARAHERVGGLTHLSPILQTVAVDRGMSS